MSAIKQSKARAGRAGASWAEVQQAWANFCQDISLFTSLQLARLIVWRTLRQRRRQEVRRAPRPAHNEATAGSLSRRRPQAGRPPAQGMDTNTTDPVWCGYLK